MIKFDVAVVGLGVHGSALAGALARRGLRVLGIESSSANRVQGASAGPWRMVRENDPLHPGLRDLGAEAMERWYYLAEHYDRSLVNRAQAVSLGAPPDQQRQRLSHIPALDARLAGLSASARAAGAIVDPDCALLHAPTAVRSLRRAAIDAGATLYFDLPCDLTRITGDGARGAWLNGSIRADLTVVCVGSRMIELPREMQPPGLRTQPAYMHWTPLWKSSGLDPNCFYIFTRGTDRFCVIPTAVGVQFGHFDAPAELDPALRRAAARSRDIAALHDVVSTLADARDVRTIDAAYTFTEGGDFEFHWSTTSVATLAACSAIGFKYAPALAEYVTAMLLADGPVRSGSEPLTVSGSAAR